MFTVRRTPATSTIASRLRLVDDLQDAAGNGQAHRAAPSLGGRPTAIPERSTAADGPIGNELAGVVYWNLKCQFRTRGTPVDRHLLRDTAYDKLCEAIVDGTLAPGEALHDEELCAWLGAQPHARCATRCAGWPTRGSWRWPPQRYTRVAPLTVRDVHEVVPLLAVVHGLATELGGPAAGRATSSQPCTRPTRPSSDALRARDGTAAYEADERFTRSSSTRAATPRSRDVLARLTPRLHRLERLCADARCPGRRSVAQHEAIITRAETGDAAGAAPAARANWMTLGSVFERGLARDD